MWLLLFSVPSMSAILLFFGVGKVDAVGVVLKTLVCVESQIAI